MPNAGAKYTRHIVVQQQVRTPGTMGGYSLAWTDYYTTFAQVKYRGSAEIVIGEQTKNVQTVEFRARWPMQHTITEAMRVLYKGLAHNITDVTDTDDGQREMVLTTKLEPGNPGG